MCAPFPLSLLLPQSRQQFVTSGALARLQNAIPSLDPRGQQHAESINVLFPLDVVAYYEQGRAQGQTAGGR